MKPITSMDKGKVAESIVKNLFKEAGFQVYHYGYEYLLPELADRENLLQGETAQFIRHQPDFVVINKRKEAFFVEVKYRREGAIKKEHMFLYPCGYVVFLKKDGIKAQSIEDIYYKGENFKDLTDMPPFKNIDRKIIEKYIAQTKRRLGDETLGGQILGNLITRTTGMALHPIKPETEAKIIGGGVDLYGWERLDKIPDWVMKKIKTKRAKMVKKDIWIAKGEHYNYKVVYQNRIPSGYRKRR